MEEEEEEEDLRRCERRPTKSVSPLPSTSPSLLPLSLQTHAFSTKVVQVRSHFESVPADEAIYTYEKQWTNTLSTIGR